MGCINLQTLADRPYKKPVNSWFTEVAMAGRIKQGQGSLIGNAGEYYVMAELLKRGWIAALAARNAPDFDILATKDGQMVKIRVKTKTEHFDPWQWAAKKDGSIFRNITQAGDFTVLVNLTEDNQQMDYFILPTGMLDQILKDDFQVWLNTPGVRGQPHNPGNVKRNLSYTKYQEFLAEFQNAWECLQTQSIAISNQTKVK